jgi:MFS family permease
MFSHLQTYFTHRRSWAVGLVFVSMGFLFGNWITLIPHVKAKFDLNDAQLGLLLLSMPFGSTFMNPFATLIINRFGMRHTTIWGLAAMAIAYSLPVSSPTIWLTSISLIITGMCLATTNVAMNTCVTAIEKHENCNIMSTSHGMFSIGGMAGAALASILIGLKTLPIIQVWVISLLIFMLSFIIRKPILSIYEEKIITDNGSKFVWPTGALLGMIAISLCTNVTEGIMADWSAIYMRDIVQANGFFIGWGFAGYALLMATGRFVGDALIPRFGSSRVLFYGGILATVGILVAVLLPHTYTTILGFGMIGAGVSCGAPILYGSAARIPNMAKGAGLATMNTFSIVGFLAGPAIIGFLSNAFGLTLAISLIALLGLGWAVLALRVKIY